MAEQALTPIIQKEVLFYEDVIVAAKMSDGTVFVPITPICDNLGLSSVGQRERINRDPVLSEAVMAISVTLSQQAREMICLPLKFIPGWLFGINANRIKPELRERVIRYQRECYEVLWEAFQEQRLTPDSELEAMLAGDTPAAQAYKMASAIMKMARQQLVLESQIASHEDRLQEHESRLETLEVTLGNAEHITPEQAMQISQAVKAVAYELGKGTRRNEYGGVYGEMYRRYGINSYKTLPRDKFDDALRWLNEWLQSLIDDSPF
jgi:hypothetical protein